MLFRSKDDGAVFPVLFGCIQGLIGTPEQILQRVRFTRARHATVGRLSDANTDCNRKRASVSFHTNGGAAGVNAFGYWQCFLRASMGA